MCTSRSNILQYYNELLTDKGFIILIDTRIIFLVHCIDAENYGTLNIKHKFSILHVALSLFICKSTFRRDHNI